MDFPVEPKKTFPLYVFGAENSNFWTLSLLVRPFHRQRLRKQARHWSERVVLYTVMKRSSQGLKGKVLVTGAQRQMEMGEVRMKRKAKGRHRK